MGNRLEEAQTACLMQGMIQALGTTEAGLEAAAGKAGVKDLVSTCRQCTKTDECILWLADRQHLDGKAPDFCLNGEALEALTR